MTQARATLIPPGHAVLVHVTTRCVRRAWLFGRDRFSNRRYDHRCGLIEARVRELADVFAVGVYAFAWMANHFHLVLAVRPDVARAWTDDEVVDRWQRIYRSKCEKANAKRRAEMLADPERLQQTRERLASLSWFMKCLNEHVSRIANAEDQTRGHFWGRFPVTCAARHAWHRHARQTRPSDVPQAPRGPEARFKSQVLLDERALLAAMAYVDLNPIRAKIANNLMGSRNTSIRHRCKITRGRPDLAAAPVMPIWGVAASTMPPISVGEYIELVDDTGRQIRKDKRGAIPAAEPRALEKLGIGPDHWTRKVKGVGSGFWRVVGTVDDIQEKAVAMGQAFLRGIGFARALVTG